MQFTLQVHSQPLISVTGRLQSTANLAHLHVPVFLQQGVIGQRFKLSLLLLKLLNLHHDGFSLLNFAFLTQLFSILVVNAQFSLHAFIIY